MKDDALAQLQLLLERQQLAALRGDAEALGAAGGALHAWCEEAGAVAGGAPRAAALKAAAALARRNARLLARGAVHLGRRRRVAAGPDGDRPGPSSAGREWTS